VSSSIGVEGGLLDLGHGGVGWGWGGVKIIEKKTGKKKKKEGGG